MEQLLDSPVFWIGVGLFCIVFGTVVMNALNEPRPPKEKKKK